ncbi:MAG: GNAT family N-acetyltransferase [Clostridia bacterium]|nr:GNAT family N-acetyltransferase [Clostridia bacterium]
MYDNIVICLGTEIEKQQLLCDYPNIKNVVRDGGYFIVAKIEETIVGYLWAFKRKIPAPVEQSEIFINIIEVIYTNLRCQGIASAMVNEVIEIAKEEKAYQVRAYCDIKNIPSHRLWLKNKFSISPAKMPDGSIVGSFVSYVL